MDKKIYLLRGFPGGPGVKTPPSSAGGMGLISDQGTKSRMSWGAAKSLKKKNKPLSFGGCDFFPFLISTK